MENDDKALLGQYRAGDREAFGRLYDRYIGKIYRFVYYKTHHRETAEDLVSRIFTKALEKIGGFDADKGTFQAWLYAIARNTVIDHYRTSRGETGIEDVWDLTGNEDAERDMDAKMKLEKVGQYLARLKSAHRDILIMRLWQGLSHAEIAAALDTSEASVKMTYSRAVNKLRREMPLDIFLLFLLHSAADFV